MSGATNICCCDADANFYYVALRLLTPHLTSPHLPIPLCSHYRRAAGALLVYDVSEKTSFNNLSSWIKNLRDTAESNSNILNCVSVVGNKVDKHAMVSLDEHNEATTKFGLKLNARTSAKTGEGIDEAFEKLVCHVYESDKERGTWNGSGRQGMNLKGKGGKGRGGCC